MHVDTETNVLVKFRELSSDQNDASATNWVTLKCLSMPLGGVTGAILLNSFQG